MTSKSINGDTKKSKSFFRRLLPSSLADSNGARNQALLLTVLYFVIGCAWIVLTDVITSATLSEAPIVLSINILKGLVFVAVSAVLIYALIFPTIRKLVELKTALQATNLQLEKALTDVQAETQKVEETQRTLIATQQHAHIGSFVFDVERGALNCSDEALSICGVKREDFNGTLNGLERHIYSDDIEQGYQLFYRAVSENRVMEFYCNVINPNVEGQVICVRFGPVFDENNNCLRILGTVYDITERWQAELSVINERNRAQMYLDVAGNIFIAINQDMVVTLINNAGCKLLCYPRDEIIGKLWPDNFVFSSCKAKFFEAHEKLRNGNDTEYLNYDNSVITGCGEERIISWKLVSIHDEDGNYNGILASGVDITDQQRTLKALHESERSKTFLLSHIPGMVYRCCNDIYWTMKFLSDGCYNLTGYWPESLINNLDLSYDDIICPEYREEIRDSIARAVENKESYRFKYEITSATGDRKWVTEVGQGVFDDDGELETLEGIVIDISESRRRTQTDSN